MASRWSDIFEREPEHEPELGPSNEPGPQPDSWFADKVEDVPPMQATQAPQPEAEFQDGIIEVEEEDEPAPKRTAEPSTWPGAVISGVRALALAPYLEPRGVYFILVLSTGEEAENESEGASIAPHARPRMRIAALPSHRIDPAGRAAVRPPHTRAVASPPLRCPHCTDPLCPNAARALLARSLGSRARQRLHRQLPSR